MNLTPIARSSSRTLTSLLIQFAEMPEDFANAVEYSVLVAQTAVYQGTELPVRGAAQGIEVAYADHCQPKR